MSESPDRIQHPLTDIAEHDASVSEYGRSMAFFLEIILVVLMMLIVLGVTSMLFAKSYSQTMEADHGMKTTLAARQTAETFQSCDSIDEFIAMTGADATEQSSDSRAIMSYVLENSDGTSTRVTVWIDSQRYSSGTLYTATIDAFAGDSANSLCELESSKYVKDGGAL